jgi:hypothetical protein
LICLNAPLNFLGYFDLRVNGQGDAMSSVMIACPRTGRGMYTAIETDETTFAKLPDVIARTSCQACGGEHLWTKRKAWLAGAGWLGKTMRVPEPLPVALKLVA